MVIPLPTLRHEHLTVDGEPSSGDYASMAGVVRLHADALQPCDSSHCDEITQLERTWRHLIGQMTRSLPQRAPEAGLGRIQELADVLQFTVPLSHRTANFGRAVTAAKRAVLKQLKPLGVEMLRPQHAFNLELVETLKQVTPNRASGSPIDLRDWTRQRLRSVADPARWQVRSHRGQVSGAVVKAVKRSLLEVVEPFARELLTRQREWNFAAADAAALATTPSPEPSTAMAALSRLSTLSDPVSGSGLSMSVKAIEPIWSEVFRRQTAFNHAVCDALAILFGVPRMSSTDYETWIAKREPHEISLAVKRQAELSDRPLISILTPIYETDPQILRECIQSVIDQAYENWELCLVDDGSTRSEPSKIAIEFAKNDPRIKFTRCTENGGIARATNMALEMAHGDFIGFLDHDDKLTPHALSEVVIRLHHRPDTDVVYSDEDRIAPDGKRVWPFFKPDWSPDLLRSCNYLCHFAVIRRSLMNRVGLLREGFEGAQDYDLLLRISEATTRIEHISSVLYHWRDSDRSMAQDVANKPLASAAGKRALEEHLRRCGNESTVIETGPTRYRVKYVVNDTPLVSIIVPFKDKPELLRQLLGSLTRVTRYENYEVILLSNNSSEPATKAFLEGLNDPRFRIFHWDHPFNYPAINNFGAKQAKGELLLFLNNDIEITDPGWLEELCGQAQRPEVGAVGPKLLFPDGTIQHAGVVLGLGGFAGHIFARMPDSSKWTAFGHADWSRNYLAVTSACVMLRREVFESLSGFDETFQVCGSDVDLCLRLIARNLRVVYTPHTSLVHHESASRRADQIPEGDFWRSFGVYRPYLQQGDPFYNRNLSLEGTVASLRENDITAEEMAVRTLATELPGSRVGTASLARVQHQHHAAAHVAGMDYSLATITAARQRSKSSLSALRSAPLKKVTWFVPYFRHPFGGVHTILRFGDLWRRHHDVESTFVIYDNPGAIERDIEARVSSIFDPLPGKFQVLPSREAVSRLPDCDLAIATLWTGAYLLLDHPRTRATAYFVQDYEPLFYAAGSFSALAENTYRMGLYGIFNTKGLGEWVTSHYPMEGTSFEPSVDHQIFNADLRETRSGPVRMFFYGRPSTDRNAFELGLEALRRVKLKFGDAVEIFSAGEAWNPEQYGVRGLISNLGVLPYEKTADLYRSIDVGLALMFTKHPSYLPFEMMSCGATVVTNNNPVNAWLFEDGKNCLVAEPTATCLAEQMGTAIVNQQLRESIGKTASLRMLTTTWQEQATRVYHHLTMKQTSARTG